MYFVPYVMILEGNLLVLKLRIDLDRQNFSQLDPNKKHSDLMLHVYMNQHYCYGFSNKLV